MVDENCEGVGSVSKTFELRKEHITLLSNMWVGWQYCETGAPEIDPKRPYGNSDVLIDIHHILTGESVDELDSSLEEKYEKLHKETETALQIILFTKSFKAGTYRLNGYGRSWELITD